MVTHHPSERPRLLVVVGQLELVACQEEWPGVGQVELQAAQPQCVTRQAQELEALKQFHLVGVECLPVE